MGLDDQILRDLWYNVELVHTYRSSVYGKNMNDKRPNSINLPEAALRYNSSLHYSTYFLAFFFHLISLASHVAAVEWSGTPKGVAL